MSITGYNVLNMYPVYVEKLYNGQKSVKIVGIRKNQVELIRDYSAINNIIKTQWFNNEEIFVVSTVCIEELNPNGCQIHNVNCQNKK